MIANAVLSLSLLVASSDPVTLDAQCTAADERACVVACSQLVKAGEELRRSWCESKPLLFLPWAGEGLFPREFVFCGCDIRPLPVSSTGKGPRETRPRVR